MVFLTNYSRGWRTLQSHRGRFMRTMATTSLREPTSEDVRIFGEYMNNRSGSVLTRNEDDLERYNTDWTGHYKGQSTVVVRPETTQEVSNILKYCNEERIGVVPQAGNTGLVGGSVSVGNELVLSIERLNRDMKFNSEEGILTCDAGCILLRLTEFCARQNHLMPLDMGSKGTCLIGGNVSTNAGGQYYYRFGSLHANVLGLEVVLADGRILDLNSDTPNRKDNTGYALHHMFIGSEGTLGIITKVALACPQLPSSRHAALVACEDWSAVRSTLSEAKKILGETLAAFEFMDEAVLEVMPAKKRILSSKHPFFLLIECQGSHEQHDAEKMEAFLEVCMENNHVVDGVLSQDLQQVHEMWELRESLNPTIKALGYNYKYDVSLPLDEYYQVAMDMRERLRDHGFADDAQVMSWGHVIDGNLHLNIIRTGADSHEENLELTKCIEPFIFETVVTRGGSISAEHGIGQSKNKYLPMAKDPSTLAIMHSMKGLFDPHGILNPSKYLPHEG